MVALSVLVFLIFFATPGIDPARQMAGKNPTPETIAAIKAEFGLDRPLPVQYLKMMDRAGHLARPAVVLQPRRRGAAADRARRRR